MNNSITLLEAEFPLDEWEGQLKGDQPHLNVEAPAPEKTTLWDGYIKIETTGSYEIKIGAERLWLFYAGRPDSQPCQPGTIPGIRSCHRGTGSGMAPGLPFPTPTSTTSRNPATSRASTPI